MHRQLSFVLTAALLACLVLAALALAEPMSKFLSYQGYLKDAAGKPVTGTKTLTFSFYSTNRPETNPVKSFTYPDVPMTNGVYSVQLGPINQIPPQQFYIGVQVAGGLVLTPLQPLTIVPYAYNASLAMQVVDGAVTTTQLADGSVSTTKLADGGVTSAKISGPLPLAIGGTGGTTAAAARSNLAAPGLATANAFTGSQTIASGGAANKGLVVRGTAGQTANLQEWQNDVGATVASVAPSGFFIGSGVQGNSQSSIGVEGVSSSGTGVKGSSTGSYGVYGFSLNSIGVLAESANSTGIWGISSSHVAIDGLSTSSTGVKGRSTSGVGVEAYSSTNFGIYAGAPKNYFSGDVGIGTASPTAKLEVVGSMKVSGAGNGVVFPDGTVQTAAKTDCLGRYEDNGDGTVTDCRTGLIWLKHANCTETIDGIIKSGSTRWDTAVSWTAALRDTFCGLSDGSFAGDWRMPTINEWRAMVTSARKQGFTVPALTNRSGTAKWTPGNLFDNVDVVSGIFSGYWSSTHF